MRAPVSASDYIVSVLRANRASDLPTFTSCLHNYPPTFPSPVAHSPTTTLAPPVITVVPHGITTDKCEHFQTSFLATPLGITTPFTSAAYPTERTKAGSSANNPWYHSIRADGSWDDEYQYTDLMALVVLDDTPHGVCFRNLQHLRAPPKTAACCAELTRPR
jgi:hypothetical protein